ncbi:MAG TPA: class I SAM-dependent methyltransferase [Candidatus Limnocylindrales bacterium]|nr:class I SAM-dependent methyltransferase [Candidatus Limnocylindrales bacterium]
MARPTPTAPSLTFACLWCGRSWTARGVDDLEAWARLCPDCLGKAGENEFLRFRLRAALEARAAATPAAPASSPAPTVPAAPPPVPASLVGPSDPDLIAYYQARAPEYDDWYLRRGRYEHGPIHDAAWNAELDAAGRWLDGLPLRGRIVELAAGTGWWSPLLASKAAELWLYDAAEAPLERARDRLLAHGQRAHIHVRDAWAPPEGDPADAMFAGFWLSHVERDRTAAFLDVARAWLGPGGRIVLIDSLADPRSGAVDHPTPADDRAIRRLADGREFTITKVVRTPDEIAADLRASGFGDVAVTTTGRFFVLATGTRP